ncbi:MAG: hypothetical protein KY458_07810 [Actinobacteria bacterium]|nr:hypothetical protein [Actinomycetota bacterium]
MTARRPCSQGRADRGRGGEFGAAVELSSTPYKVARRTDSETADLLKGNSGVRVLARRDGTPLALFENPYRLQRLDTEHPTWRLEAILGGT